MPTVKTVKANIKRAIEKENSEFSYIDYEEIQAWFNNAGFEDSDEIDAFNNDIFLRNWPNLQTGQDLALNEDVQLNKNVAKYVLNYAGNNSGKSVDELNVLISLLSAMDKVIANRYQAIVDNMGAFIANKKHVDSEIEDDNYLIGYIAAAQENIKLLQKAELHLSKPHLTGTIEAQQGKNNLGRLLQNADKLESTALIFDNLSETKKGLTQERFDAIMDKLENINENNADALIRCINVMEPHLHLTGDKITGKGKDNLANLLEYPKKLGNLEKVFTQFTLTKRGLTQERFDAVLEAAKNNKIPDDDPDNPNNIDGLLGCIAEMSNNNLHFTGDKITGEGKNNFERLLNCKGNLAALKEMFTNISVSRLDPKEPTPGLTQESFDVLIDHADKIDSGNRIYLSDCISSMKNIYLNKDDKGEHNLAKLLKNSEKSEFLMGIFKKMAEKKPGLTQDRFDVVMDKINNINEHNTDSFVQCIESMQNHDVHLTGDKLTGKGKDNLSKLLDAPEKIGSVTEILSKMQPLSQNRYNTIIHSLPNINNDNKVNIVDFIEILKEQNLPLTQNGVLAQFIAFKPEQQKSILQILDALSAINSDSAYYEDVVKNMKNILQKPENIGELCQQIKTASPEKFQLNWFDKLLKTLFNVQISLNKLLETPKSTPEKSMKNEMNALRNTASPKSRTPVLTTPSTRRNSEETTTNAVLESSIKRRNTYP